MHRVSFRFLKIKFGFFLVFALNKIEFIIVFLIPELKFEAIHFGFGKGEGFGVCPIVHICFTRWPQG